MQHVTPHIPEINESVRTHCREDRPFCGYPWFLPVKFLSKSATHPFSFIFIVLILFSSFLPHLKCFVCICRKNWYLPAPEVSPSSPVEFSLLSKEETSWGTVKMTFSVKGQECFMWPDEDKSRWIVELHAEIRDNQIKSYIPTTLIELDLRHQRRASKSKLKMSSDMSSNQH